jgi:hypothetical protein
MTDAADSTSASASASAVSASAFPAFPSAADPFLAEMEKSFQDDEQQLKLSKCMITFKDSKFVFQRYGAEKGVSCYRSEAVKTAQMLPEMIRCLKKIKEGLEMAKAKKMAENPDYNPNDENEKTRNDGRIRSEIIQKNKSFEKHLGIQIYKGQPQLGLTLILLDTKDGIPRPCSGTAPFDEPDDPDRILAFIDQWMPRKGRADADADGPTLRRS